MYATSPTLAQMRSINGVTVRGSTTVNMPRDLDDALQVNAYAFVDVWQQIHALWRCDERCPSNNVDGVCWRNAVFQADGSRWCDAVTRKVEGVTPNCPPQSLISRLEGRAAARKQPVSSSTSSASSVFNQHIYPYAVDQHPRPITPKDSAAAVDGQLMSSPLSKS
jgi:hypothetical protein